MGYSASAALGREEARARTKGRRKVIAERIEYREPERSNVRALPGAALPPHRSVEARLIGSCGHVLRWVAAVPVSDGAPSPPPYLTAKVGKRMTCMHDDCVIPPQPPREPRPDDCTWDVYEGKDDDGEDIQRRCRVRGKWDTDLGLLCTRHRDHLLEQGHLDEPGTPHTTEGT